MVILLTVLNSRHWQASPNSMVQSQESKVNMGQGWKSAFIKDYWQMYEKHLKKIIKNGATFQEWSQRVITTSKSKKARQEQIPEARERSTGKGMPDASSDL